MIITEVMGRKSNITADTKTRKRYFELKEVYPKGIMTGKESCSGDSEQEKIQRNNWDQIIGISTLIRIVPLILPLFHKITAKMSFIV